MHQPRWAGGRSTPDPTAGTWSAQIGEYFPNLTEASQLFVKAEGVLPESDGG
jgi:hypothetical protein